MTVLKPEGPKPTAQQIASSVVVAREKQWRRRRWWSFGARVVDLDVLCGLVEMEVAQAREDQIPLSVQREDRRRMLEALVLEMERLGVEPGEPVEMHP